MNCESIREAIDNGNTCEAVHSHLDNSHLDTCGACRKYETETASLLSLLSAQPRVKAPANFEAQLQARLATEEVKLAALVNSLPPVAAPANFDLRLRGRMAQANADNAASGLLAWLEQFWAESFSFGQAATAMTAVALIVAFSVVQFNRSGNQTAATDNIIAAVTNQPANTSDKIAASPQTQPSSASTIHLTTLKSIAKLPRQLMPAVKAAAVPAQPVVESKLIASNTNERTIINAQTRQEAKLAANGIAIGQQLAKFVAPPKAELVSLAF